MIASQSLQSLDSFRTLNMARSDLPTKRVFSSMKLVVLKNLAEIRQIRIPTDLIFHVRHKGVNAAL